MKDDIIYKHALTFSHEELAGMYAIISKREVEYLKEIKILRLSLQSHREIVEMNAKLKRYLDFLLNSYSSPEEVTRRRHEVYEALERGI